MTYRALRKQLVAALWLMALAALLHSKSPAGKPGSGGGGPVPPGTIYFISSGWHLWSMNGDGSGKTPGPAVDTPGLPTWQRHGGARWYLENVYDESMPDASGQWFAVSEAGGGVPLTNDPDLRWNGDSPAWARDDSFFSYCGVYLTADEWIGRLFVVPVDWTGGIPTGGPPMLVLELHRSLFDEWGQESVDGAYEVSLSNHDWSPVGNEAVLTRWVWGEGWVLDVASFSEEGVATRRLTYGTNPEWSPDGARIAFNRFQFSGSQEIRDIWTINPDGTGARQLTTYSSGKGGERQQYGPTWSPDGAYIAFTQKVIKGQVYFDIQRIPSGGGSAVSLTSDGTSFLPRWRP